MREIKFRLRDRDNKIVGYEKWYPGAWSEERGEWEAHPCWLYSKDNKYWIPTPIPHCHKDQYTDLPDKNGCEIYEEDIVQLDPEHISEILFRDGGFGFIFCDDFVGFSGQLQLQEILKDFEILGTIYENPELVACASPASPAGGA